MLRRYLRGRNEWPRYREFQRAGLKGLRDAITHQGETRWWAEAKGVPYTDHPPGYAPIWTEERPELAGMLEAGDEARL